MFHSLKLGQSQLRAQEQGCVQCCGRRGVDPATSSTWRPVRRGWKPYMSARGNTRPPDSPLWQTWRKPSGSQTPWLTWSQKVTSCSSFQHPSPGSDFTDQFLVCIATKCMVLFRLSVVCMREGAKKIRPHQCLNSTRLDQQFHWQGEADTVPDYEDWGFGEPTAASEHKSCVWMETEQRGRWRTASCTKSRPFVCEMSQCEFSDPFYSVQKCSPLHLPHIGTHACAKLRTRHHHWQNTFVRVSLEL